jgi:hypothetical protein
MYAVKTRTGSVYLQLEKRGGTRTRSPSHAASRTRARPFPADDRVHVIVATLNAPLSGNGAYELVEARTLLEHPRLTPPLGPVAASVCLGSRGSVFSLVAFVSTSARCRAGQRCGQETSDD